MCKKNRLILPLLFLYISWIHLNRSELCIWKKLCNKNKLDWALSIKLCLELCYEDYLQDCHLYNKRPVAITTRKTKQTVTRSTWSASWSLPHGPQAPIKARLVVRGWTGWWVGGQGKAGLAREAGSDQQLP